MVYLFCFTKRLNRNFITCDINQKSIEQTNNRLNDIDDNYKSFFEIWLKYYAQFVKQYLQLN